MSHFTVGIIVPPKHLDDVMTFVDRQMSRYDENKIVPPYVCYSIEHAKHDIDRDIRQFSQIIERQDPNYDLEKCQDVLDELKNSTPEQRYKEYIVLHDRFNCSGEPLSTRNPLSKWDWYDLGGRWGGWFYDRVQSAGSIVDNLATVEHVIEREKFPFAIITPDGEWHEQGHMGWFGIVKDGIDISIWHAQSLEILENYSGQSMVLIDAHI